MVGQIIIALFGAAIILLALVMGQRATIGLEANSVGQLTLIALGGLLIALGVAGRRLSQRQIGKGYQQVAVILLNTLLLIVVLELLVIVSFNAQFVARDQQLVAANPGLPVFQGADWLPVFEREDAEGRITRYSSFDLWTMQPYSGETLTILADGARGTTDSDCQPDSYRIFMYGGSTLWGVSTPDWGTIPAYVQAALNAQFEGRVCVVNYGENGFVSTQEVIRLMKQLQRDNVPDMVIFYDGVNDVIAAYNAREAGAHRNLSGFVNAITTAPPNPLVQWLLNTHLVRFIQALIPGSTAQTTEQTDYLALSQETTAVYLNNVRMAKALAADYEIEAVFIWQPVMVVGDKPLTDEEVVMAEVVGGDLLTMYRETWAGIAAAELDNLTYIADVFDGIEAPLYFDHHHLAPQGNEIIAQRILEIITPALRQAVQ